jgi:hypothetical protein
MDAASMPEMSIPAINGGKNSTERYMKIFSASPAEGRIGI